MRLGFLFLFICIIIAIFNPEITLQGATYGLSTWLYGLVPTLLPFIILSNFILSPEIFGMLESILPQGLKKHYVKFCVFFNIFAGFTFGLPVGAKITTNLLKNHQISPTQGQILLNNCNSIGPAFVGGFFLTKCIHKSEWFVLTLIILYVPQLCTSLFQLWRIPSFDRTIPSIEKKEISRFKNCFQILDISILNGFETIMILGGYLLAFGIICAYMAHISFLPHAIKVYLISILEITSGIRELSLLPTLTSVKYLLSMPLLTFGGLCTLMQTKSIINGYRLSIKAYLCHKIIFSGITATITMAIMLILC